MSISRRVALQGVVERSGQSALSQFLWVTGFACATGLGARLEIPHQPVPYTLQTLVVLLAGAFLGARNGMASQLLYLAAGVLGAPVFSGGGFGLARLFGPTGGYLIAFPMAAAVVGYLVHQRTTLLWALISMAVGLLVVFCFGTIHLYAFYLHSWGNAVQSGFLIFSWWDVLKLGAAAMIYHEMAKRWPRIPM